MVPCGLFGTIGATTPWNPLLPAVPCFRCPVQTSRPLQIATGNHSQAALRNRFAYLANMASLHRVVLDSRTLRVVKKDGTRVPFDRDKLLRGLHVACHKRPVSADELARAARPEAS